MFFVICTLSMNLIQISSTLMTSRSFSFLEKGLGHFQITFKKIDHTKIIQRSATITGLLQ